MCQAIGRKIFDDGVLVGEPAIEISLFASLAAITKIKGKTTYFLYLTGVKGDRFALLVKIDDITHNMSDLTPGTLRDKYELALYYLTH